MTKTELLSTYTVEQLANILVVAMESKKDDEKMIELITSAGKDLGEQLDEKRNEINRLQSEVEKYRKAFENAKKERDCQIAEYRKKIEELENHHKFCMMQIDDVLVEFLGVTHEVMDKPHDFEMVLQELIDKNKTELERAKNTIKNIDYILEKLFDVRHDTVDKPDEFEKILSERLKRNVTDFIPTEPIKVADMLINASKKRTNCMTGKEYDKYIFEKWQLRQIAEHLLVYCNHNGDVEG